MPRRARAGDARPDDAGDVLAARVIELMRATAMPNGLAALGFDGSHLDALATGAEPQYRVIRNAPKDVGRDDLKALFARRAQLLVADGIRADAPAPESTRCTRREGRRTVNVLPRPGSLTTSSSAWWRSSTCLTIASPRPVPPVARERLRSTR